MAVRWLQADRVHAINRPDRDSLFLYNEFLSPQDYSDEWMTQKHVGIQSAVLFKSQII